MKKMLLAVMALALAGSAFASDAWSTNVLRGSGGRLNGNRNAAVLEAEPTQVGCVALRRSADIPLQTGYLVCVSTATTYPNSVTLATNALENITSVAGVVVSPYGAPQSFAIGDSFDMAIDGDVLVQAVPLSITKGDLLGSVASSGKVTKTTTANTMILQALETKTTTSTDKFIRARFMRR